MPRLDGMVMEVERIGEEIIFDTVDSPLSLGLHSFSFLSPSVTFLLLFILSLYFLSFFFPSSSSSSCTFNIVPRVWSLVREDPLELEMAIDTSILACRIPWTEEPGGIQSMRSQRVRHDWARSSREEAYRLAWFYVSPFCNRPNLYLQTINEEFLFSSAQCLGNIGLSFRREKSRSGLSIIFQCGLGADYLMSLNIDFLSCKMEIKFVLLTLVDL